MSKLFGVVIPTLVSAFAVTGCGGGSAGSPASPPITNVPSQTSAHASSTVPADALQQVAPLNATANGPAVARIYVADFAGSGFGSVKAFSTDGTLLLGTTTGLDGPQNIVTNARGDVFVANFGGDCITSFTKTLQTYKPNISLGASPVGLALGPKGKLYATLYPSGTLVTYSKNGKQISPTIPGPGVVTYVAVDPSGKIYITNSSNNTLTTYKPNGTPTTPTITAGLNGPGPVVVDRAGKIYVANDGGTGSITTYNPDGSQTAPTIAVNNPHGLAVAENGNIYVSDSVDKVVDAFKADGTPTTPTLKGFSSPTGVAVISR